MVPGVNASRRAERARGRSDRDLRRPISRCWLPHRLQWGTPGHPEPHPEPGCELDCGVRAPFGGVISTSWKTPPRGSETTTNAGELLRVPAAQLGRQLFKVNVPLPSAVLPQLDHVTVDIEISPAQPMSRVSGRTWGFDPGVHDITVGSLAADVAGRDAVVAAGEASSATEASVTTWPPDGGERWELRASPAEKPIARAARTAAATPSRTTMLR